MGGIHERWTQKIEDLGIDPRSDETFVATPYQDVPCSVLDGIKAAFIIVKEGNGIGFQPGFYIVTNLLPKGLSYRQIKDAISDFALERLTDTMGDSEKARCGDGIKFRPTQYQGENGTAVIKIEHIGEDERKELMGKVESGELNLRYTPIKKGKPAF